MEKEYEMLCSLFGVGSRCWSMVHLNYSYQMFCPKNKKDIIAEYLIWEEFVERAQEKGFVYYFGIDRFLEQYKLPVYKCLNIVDEI